MAAGAGRVDGSAGDRPARPSAWARIGPWLRGEPLHVPSHALVIHFPAALLPTSLAVDLAGHAAPGVVGGNTAVVLLVLGLAGGLLAAATGLLDWVEMIPGPRRARVTRHLLVQVAAVGAFALSLAVRWPWPDGPAPAVAIGLSIVGTGLLFAGDHLGGLLVYRDGMRVRTGRPR